MQDDFRVGTGAAGCHGRQSYNSVGSSGTGDRKRQELARPKAVEGAHTALHRLEIINTAYVHGWTIYRDTVENRQYVKPGRVPRVSFSGPEFVRDRSDFLTAQQDIDVCRVRRPVRFKAADKAENARNRCGIALLIGQNGIQR